MGWWDEQNLVSYGDDDILFSVFHVEALHLPWTKLIVAVFSTLRWHVIETLFVRVGRLGLRCIFLFNDMSDGQEKILYISV